MTYIKLRIFGVITFITLLLILLLTSCNKSTAKENKTQIKSISEAEIISFQKAYGVSFNGIAQAIEEDTYYELKAKEHIDRFYNFEEGKVMFKIGHQNDKPFRYSYEGLLSYLIGKSKSHPNDNGIAKENWRKIDWENMGLIMEKDMAVAIGKVTMKNDDDQTVQNYTMVMKRNQNGDIKLIAHQILLSK